MTDKLEVVKCHHAGCGHEWEPRVKRPKKCPVCQNPLWKSANPKKRKPPTPKVVEATVGSALIPGREGDKSRKMILDHARFLPMPKSQTVNVYGDATIDQSRKMSNVTVLPALEAGAKRMADRFNDLAPSVPALPPAEMPSEEGIVEGEFEDLPGDGEEEGE